MLKETRLIKIGLGIAATMTAFCVHAANGQPLPAPKVNALTQKVWDNPDVTEQSKGIRTLQDYIVQEKEMWDYIFENHPIFATYGKDGRVIGTPVISPAVLSIWEKAMPRSILHTSQATVQWPLSIV